MGSAQRRRVAQTTTTSLDSLCVEIHMMIVAQLEAEGLMALRAAAKQFRQLCAEAALAQLRACPRISTVNIVCILAGSPISRVGTPA